MDENEEFEFRLRAEQEAAAQTAAPPIATPKPAAPSNEGMHEVTIDGRTEMRPDFGVGEAAQALMNLPGVGAAATMGQGATRFVGKILGGLAGLLGGGAEAVEGVTGAVNRATELPASNDPVLTAMNAAGNVAAKVTAPAEEAMASSDNPLVRDVLPAVGEAAADLAALTPAGPEVMAARAARTAKEAARPKISPAVGKAVDQEYHLRPVDVKANSPGAKVPGEFRERLHNPAELKNDTILHNQQVTTRKAGSDLGLDNASRIDEKALEDLRKPHNANYDAAGKAAGKFRASTDYGTDLAKAVRAAPPELRIKAKRIVDDYANDELSGPELVTSIRTLRNRATRGIQSKVVAEQELGYVNRQVADALEAELGRRLEGGGDAKLFKQYKDSRQSLAKINNVADATYGGQVDAQVLAKLKRKGVPLSGHLQNIADTAEEFKHVMQHSSRVASGGPGVVDSKAGVIRGVVSGIAKKIPGADVRSESFNRKLGAKAERPTASMRDVPAEEVPPQLGTETVPFERTPVQPSLAQQLAGDLELAPEPVVNPQQLPPAPPRMTAEAPAPIRGDIEFTPTNPTALGDQFTAPSRANDDYLAATNSWMDKYVPPDNFVGPSRQLVGPAEPPPVPRDAPTLAQQLAGDLELQHRAPAGGPDMIEFAPPNLGDLLAGPQQLAPSNIVDDLVAQLGLNVDTVQPPPAELVSPPGRVGKPKKRK